MTRRHRRDTKCWAKASRISRDDRGRADSSARCSAINSAVRLDRVGMTHHSSTRRLEATDRTVWTRSPRRSHPSDVKDPLSQYPSAGPTAKQAHRRPHAQPPRGPTGTARTAGARVYPRGAATGCAAGRRLAQEQTEAIIQVLAWLAAHPPTPTAATRSR